MTVYTSAQCLVCIVLRSWSKYGLCAGVNVLLSHYNAKEWSYVASSMDVLMMLTAWNYQVPFFVVRLMVPFLLNLQAKCFLVISDFLYGPSNVLSLLLLMCSLA